MKKIFSVVLALVLALSIAQINVFAVVSDVTPTVTFDVSKPDAGGIFIISVTIKNAKYIGFEFKLNYDKTVINPVKFINGSATTYYTEVVNYPTVAISTDGKIVKDWFKEIGTKLDVANGILTAGHYANFEKS